MRGQPRRDLGLERRELVGDRRTREVEERGCDAGQQGAGAFERVERVLDGRLRPGDRRPPRPPAPLRGHPGGERGAVVLDAGPGRTAAGRTGGPTASAKGLSAAGRREVSGDVEVPTPAPPTFPSPGPVRRGEDAWTGAGLSGMKGKGSGSAPMTRRGRLRQGCSIVTPPRRACCAAPREGFSSRRTVAAERRPSPTPSLQGGRAHGGSQAQVDDRGRRIHRRRVVAGCLWRLQQQLQRGRRWRQRQLGSGLRAVQGVRRPHRQADLGLHRHRRSRGHRRRSTRTSSGRTARAPRSTTRATRTSRRRSSSAPRPATRRTSRSCRSPVC